jgi:hypothetical protein
MVERCGVLWDRLRCAQSGRRFGRKSEQDSLEGCGLLVEHLAPLFFGFVGCGIPTAGFLSIRSVRTPQRRIEFRIERPTPPPYQPPRADTAAQTWKNG